MTSPPTFNDDRSYYVVKVRQGETAKISCQAKGDPVPIVTWFSPTHRVIPRSLGSRFYLERVVVSDVTLEVRLAQKRDAGNYTCRASNLAGERSIVVGLEVEVPNPGLSHHVPGSAHSSRSGGGINDAGKIQYGVTNGVSSKVGNRNSSINDNTVNNGRIRNIVPSTGISTSGFSPALGSSGQNGFDRPASGTSTRLDSTVIGVGLGRNIGIKPNDIGININGPGILSSRSSVGNNHSRGESVGKNSVTNNEVSARKPNTDANSSRHSETISSTSKNARDFSSSVSNIGATTGTLSRSSEIGVNNENSRKTGTPSSTRRTASNLNTQNFNTGVGIKTVKQQAVKGQTVLLPCPSQASPPPRLAWLLPGNGVLPTPYYGSRLTVHRNGSLELRGVRLSDSGILICVARGERDETRIQVELEVSEPWEEAINPHGGPSGERSVQESTGASSQSLSSRSVLPERPLSRIPITQKPLPRGWPLPADSHPLGPPPRSTVPHLEPAVRTRAAPLVTIINGETIRLPCSASETHGHYQGSLLWTTPSGKVLSRGQSGESGRYHVQEDGTLIVQRTTVFDRGTYTCKSTSYDLSSVFTVTIPVIVIAYPPRITMGPSPVTYTRPGVAVELPCLTTATPRATVTWEMPDLTRLRVMGQARIYGNRYLSPQGSLVIQNPTSRDTGFYRCTASNVIGVDTKATYLHVI